MAVITLGGASEGCLTTKPHRDSVCRDGSDHCAAAAAPAGMRAVRKGFRIKHVRWIDTINRESGVPDLGLQAEWEPTTRRD
jgi:hypothetical protein